jgi:hypothetical protein
MVIAAALATLAAAICWSEHPTALAAAPSRLEVHPGGPLFTADDSGLYPGGPSLVREVVVTYYGPEVSVVALYVGNFLARTPSSASSCVAADPTRLLVIEVRQAGHSLFGGALSEFAAEHGDAPNALPIRSPHGATWRDGDSAEIQLGIQLDQRADNSYMGCRTGADINWVAG